ncbi:helix-turn-helix transcriptional regulator [Rothia sp. LK2588]|uniref:helix-turn-helix domain-containing protein n=1 Tax=Rothia sp. LK2588 TaxID=3114369 RepID=UPI0034CD7C52
MNYQQEVAGNVRAEASRRNIGKDELAKAVGLGSSAIHYRWSGEKEWRLSELSKIAPVLGVSISVLTHSESDVTALAA